MPRFSKRSLNNLKEVHPDLQKICHEAIKVTDFIVICGHRGKEEQDKAFASGNSKLRFPRSKHNKSPSLAVDLVPYPLDWNDIESFKSLAAVIKKVANDLGIGIVSGGDWKMRDWPHFELKE